MASVIAMVRERSLPEGCQVVRTKIEPRYSGSLKMKSEAAVISFCCCLLWEVEMRTDAEQHHVSFDIKSVLVNSQRKCIWGRVPNCSGSPGTLKTYPWRIRWFSYSGKPREEATHNAAFFFFCHSVFSPRELLRLLSSELHGGCSVISWASIFWPSQN